MRQSNDMRAKTYVQPLNVSRLVNPRRLYRAAHRPERYECIKFMTCNTQDKDWSAYHSKVFFADLVAQCRQKKVD